MSLAYERNAQEIYRRSFAVVKAEADLSMLPENLHPVAIRMMHACGQTDLPADLACSDDVVTAARTALAAGVPILCDSEMVGAGIIRRRLSGNPVEVRLNDPRATDLARDLGTTRSAAGVELWHERIGGAVVVIGNAPTALFHLLERLDDGWPHPAAILAFPVGFVGAAESKAELAANPRGVPFLTLLGRRGGSAMAAAALNAIAGKDAEGAA